MTLSKASALQVGTIMRANCCRGGNQSFCRCFKIVDINNGIYTLALLKNVMTDVKIIKIEEGYSAGTHTKIEFQPGDEEARCTTTIAKTKKNELIFPKDIFINLKNIKWYNLVVCEKPHSILVNIKRLERLHDKMESVFGISSAIDNIPRDKKKSLSAEMLAKFDNSSQGNYIGGSNSKNNSKNVTSTATYTKKKIRTNHGTTSSTINNKAKNKTRKNPSL
tara:strand:- start:207 stop:869 length:663 start_codon:yes stop_codon:yes gene_type:complete